MQLTLDEQETRVLRNLLHDYLPEVRREAARTDMVAHDLRHELNSRVELCERLLAELEGGLTGSS